MIKILATSALALAALTGAARADVTIGMLLPQTGFAAGFGAEQQGAIDLFMQKYADLGPAGKLKLVTYDTRAEPATAISLAKKLIETDKVTAILGPYFSGEVEAVFPVANRAGMPIVAPTATKPGLTAANRPWTFRNSSTTDKIDSGLIAHWLSKQEKPIKKVVLFYDARDGVSSNDGKAVMPAAIKANGLELLDSITYQTKDVDFSAQVTRAKALNPDGFVITSLFTESGHVVAELRKQGLNQPIAIGVEIGLNPKFIEIAGSAAEGVMTVAEFNRDNPRPQVVQFVKEYEALVKYLPGNSAALMYDALFLMRHCIMSKGVTGATDADKVKIRDCWANLKDVDAPISGPSSIDANGDSIRSAHHLVVRNGKFVVSQ
jgi:branched-chain amino acid transport system substrate-binding protein